MKKEKDKKDKKEEKKKISLKRTFSNNIFALREIWKASPLHLSIYIGSSVIYGLFDFLSGGYLLRRIVDGVESGEEIASIITYIAVLGILNVLINALLNWYWQMISPVEHRKIAASVEKKLFVKSAEVELACYESPSFYDKYVRAMDEAYNRILKVMWTLDGLVSRIIALAANSLLLFFIDPVLILFGLFPLVLGIFKRREHVVHHKLQTELKPINRKSAYVRRAFYLGEYAKEIRIGGIYENMLRDLRGTYKDFCSLTRKYGMKKTILAYVQVIGLEVVTILGATLYAVFKTLSVGSMSIGDCIVVLGSIGTISYCLNALVQNFAEFGEHALFLDDVRFFLDYTPAILDGEEIAPKGGGDISVRNVSFRYDGAEADTLTDVNFTIKMGERIALVGGNGSGKTTLVKLLLRLYDPKEGEILLDGKNIKDMTLSSYRGGFSTVFQDFKIFSMSVKDNVLLRPSEEGDEELVKSALVESGAYDKVSGFENGLETILTREFDDKGQNLSIGEQQKLSLARVFADDTPFVILDEPSSALDPIAEYKMFENMMRATEGRSVVFISHRLSSAVLADRVFLMDGGTVAEIGTHEELMALGGKYAAMFRRQAENYLGSEVTDNE